MSGGYRQRIHPMNVNRLPSLLETRGSVTTIPVEELDLATSSSNYGNVDIRGQGIRQDSFRNTQTLEEVRWSSMRKKIPGMSSVPRRITENSVNLDLHSRYMQDLRQFIRQHFHMKECSCFIPVPNQTVAKIKQLKCHCGAVLTEHAGMSLGGSQVMEQYIVHKELQRIVNRRRLDEPVPARLPVLNWTPEYLRKTVTNTFGKIKFVNVEHIGGTKPAKYIRISADDSVEDLFELMTKYWQIMEPQAPNLVISVVGGAKNFKLDGRMRTTFATGLVKAAKTTSAWLISSGFNMGVMKAVGQAVNQGQSFCWDNNRMAHVLRCIGIAPWGYIRHKQSLVETEDGQGKFYAEYRTSNVILHGEPVPLNADHTHFIYVDDGFRNRYGGVAAMRSKIEQKISQSVADGGLGIPVVLVVVEGGTDAIADAKSSLEHRIPVVVCSGTGRAADILAYAYSHTKTTSGGVREMSEKHQLKLKDKIFDNYGKSWKEEEIDAKTEAIKESVQFCCQNADLMIIFNMNKAEDLDMAILSVLLKAHAGGDEIQRLTQLRLALTWNRVDIAQEEIFREDVLWRQGSLDDIVTEAIVTDKVQFMQLILEQGVIMKEYLTLDRLDLLYSKVPKHHAIYKLLFKLTGTTELTRKNVIRLLGRLLDRYERDEQLAFDDDIFEEVGDETVDAKKVMFFRPYKHLLIYAVLLHRQSLAKFCWEMGDEPVTTAVAVTRLYNAMIRHITQDESSHHEAVIAYKIEFENIAATVLDECQQRDPEKAMMIVERKSPVWNEMTCLQIAAASNDQMFISSEACQNSVSTTWKQGIISGWSMILLGTLFPPLIVFIVEIVPLGSETLSWYQKLAAFYTSPIIKFAHNTMMYLVFVCLHSYMVLVEFRPDKVTFAEVLCVCWIFTFMVDHIHSFLVFPAPTVTSKLRDVFGIMTYLEWLNYVVCYVGFSLHIAGFYNVTKVLYCINSIIFFVGITKSYTAFGNLGYKLVMIKRMFGELRLFLCVLLIFLLAYGIAHQGLLYRQRSPSWAILKDVFYYPYWQLYGEIYLDEIGSEDTCVSGTMDCRTTHWLVPIILAAYLMVGNIMLINLLIAIFSNVFHQVEKNSIEIWKFQMYFMAMEYDKKTFLVPPFSIVPQTVLALHWLVRRTCCTRQTSTQTLGRRHLEYLQLFEKEMMTNYLRRAKASKLASLETTVQKLEKQVDELTKLIEDEVIGDQQPDPMSFAMTDDGQSFVWKKTDSWTAPTGHPFWPSVREILSVKDQVTQSDIPKEYYGKPMMRSGSGLFVLPAKTPADTSTMKSIAETETDNKQMEAGRSQIEEMKDTETAENHMPKERNEDIRTENIETKEGKLVFSKATDEAVDEVNDSTVNMLSEKEQKKLEKLRRKDERRMRKDEKKARREKSKERCEDLKVLTENGDGLAHDTSAGINDVNQPHGEDNTAKMSVSFHLGDSVVKPGIDRDSMRLQLMKSHPHTALDSARSPEIMTQAELVDVNKVTDFNKRWNIAEVELEQPRRKEPAWSPYKHMKDGSDDDRGAAKGRRFSGGLQLDSSSDDVRSLREKLRKKIKKKKRRKKKEHVDISD